MAVQLTVRGAALALGVGLLCFAATPAEALVIGLPVNNVGLVGYWPLNESSGTSAPDGSGYGHSATLAGGATWVTGKYGNAVSFDGVDGEADVASTFGLGTTNMTISVWANLDSTSENGAFVKIGGTSPNRGFAVGVGSGSFDSVGNHLVLLYEGVRWIDTSVSIGTGWHHVAMTINASGYPTAYLDGVQVYTDTTGAGAAPSGSITYIGGYTGAGTENRHADATLDDVRVYSRALTGTEIAAIYAATGVRMRSASFLDNGTTLEQNLADEWTFDGGDMSGATAYDRTGGNNGTLTNSPTLVQGRLGQAVDLNGSNQTVSIGNISPTKSLPFTASAWFKADGTTAGALLNKYVSGSWNGFNLFFQSGALCAWYLTGTSGNNYTAVSSQCGVGAVSAPTPTTGVWHHVVVTVSTSGMNMYIDGSLAATSGWTGSTANSSETTSMNLGLYTTYYDGAVDDVRLYNRALTAAEAKQLYNLGAAKMNASATTLQSGTTLSSGLVGYWSFNGPDISGSTTYDRSGSGNDGTAIGSPTPAQGKSGQALNFGGSSYINIGSPTSLNLNGAITLSVWARGTSASGVELLVGNWILSGSFNYGIFWSDSGSGHGTKGIECLVGPSGYSGLSTNPYADGRWHHFVCTWDGSSVSTLYVDGGQIDQTSHSSSVSNSTRAWHIGAGSSQWYFPGGMDEVRVYNRSLSASEVKQLYNLGQ